MVVDDHSCIGSWNGCLGMKAWLDESGFLNARSRCELCLKPVNGLMPECFQITSDPFRSLQPTKICKFNLKVWPWSGQNWSFHVLFMCHDFQTSSDVCHAIDKLKRTNRGFISLSMLHLHWSNWLISFRPKSICQEFAEVAFSEAFVLSEETKQKRRLSPVGLTRRRPAQMGASATWRRLPWGSNSVTHPSWDEHVFKEVNHPFFAIALLDFPNLTNLISDGFEP